MIEEKIRQLSDDRCRFYLFEALIPVLGYLLRSEANYVQFCY
jgi:hypothetical protein